MMPASQLRSRLTSAVDDTTVPAGLAHAALAGGRSRRRRRTAGGLALATAAVVGGVLLLPHGGSTARDAQVAGGGTATSEVAWEWARSLPQGSDPTLPFFGEGGALWSDGQRHDVPASVNRTMPPREVAGGWLVFIGAEERDFGVAVLSADGTLRRLPSQTSWGEGLFDARPVVSADGRRAALGEWVVDVVTMQVRPVPHQPPSSQADGFSTTVRMIGFTRAGLVYEGAPFSEGLGTTWLLRDDGTTVQVDPPRQAHIPERSPADVALAFDYSDDSSDTCTTSYALQAASWVEDGNGCMGRSLGEALAVSPDHQWLITDDLPEVWNLEAGAFDRVDMPAEAARSQIGGVVWERGDSFLLPVSDRWDDTVPIGESYDHAVQVVRCTMSTGTCERAGSEQDIRVTTTMWGTTELRFAGS